MSSVIWCGPVIPMQVPGATVPGAEVFSAGCTGDGYKGTPVCRKLAYSWGSLASALDKFGGTPPVYFGAHSAGGIVVKVICAEAANRRLVRAVMLSDAIYGDLGDNEGFVAFVVDAIREGNRMFVSTNSNVPSGSGTGTPSNVRLQEVRREVERRAGLEFEELPPSAWSGIVDYLPVELWRLGPVWLANYEGTLGHGHTTLQPGLWQNLLQPWDAVTPPLRFDEPAVPGLPTISGEPDPWWKRGLVAFGSAALGYGAVRLLGG